MPTVSVRLFAALRDVAAAQHVEASGETVADVIEELSARYGERFGKIAHAGSVVIDGERASIDRRVAAGDEIVLLPPVSGG